MIGRQFISTGAIELKGTHRTEDASLRGRLPQRPSVCDTLAPFTKPRLIGLSASPAAIRIGKVKLERSVGRSAISVIVTVALITSPAGCYRLLPPVRFEIQEGFRGWVEIHHSQPNAKPLPLIEGTCVYRIPASGILYTSSPLEEGFAETEYWYVDDNGNRLSQLEPRGLILGGSVAKSGGSIVHRFFIGTLEELEKDRVERVKTGLEPRPPGER